MQSGPSIIRSEHQLSNFLSKTPVSFTTHGPHWKFPRISGSRSLTKSWILLYTLPKRPGLAWSGLWRGVSPAPFNWRPSRLHLTCSSNHATSTLWETSRPPGVTLQRACHREGHLGMTTTPTCHLEFQIQKRLWDHPQLGTSRSEERKGGWENVHGGRA